MDAGEKLRVVIVEDEGLFRDLLTTVLSQSTRLEVVGSFADAESALEAIPGLAPDVAILDVALGGELNGVQVGLLLRHELPALSIVLLSNYADREFITALPTSGVGGWCYLLKESVTDVAALERAIEGAADRLLVLDAEIVAALQAPTAGRLATLSRRQRQILALVAQGFTNAAIARQLGLIEKSVENHLNNIYQRLGIDRANTTMHPRVRAVLIFLQESRLEHPNL